MLPDPIHLQTAIHQDRLRAEVAANRTRSRHTSRARHPERRFPQLLRRLAGQHGAASA